MGPTGASGPGGLGMIEPRFQYGREGFGEGGGVEAAECGGLVAGAEVGTGGGSLMLRDPEGQVL
eukprot:2687211-Prorocentrum_lima.AAC.1